MGLSIRPLACVALAVGAVGCGGPRVRPPPEWFARPPAADARSLWFVGDATGPEEGAARELAVQKALAALTQYCGAVVRSEFESLERETNGRVEQTVSLRVDLAGEEITLREAVVEETVVREGPGGVEAFALVRWPKAQYQEVLAMQQARGRRALAAYLEAERSLEARLVAGTKERLQEARRALGPARAQVPLDDERFGHTGLLWDAIELLGERVESFETARRRVVAVGVDCSERSAPVACPEHRVGQLRSRVTALGLEVSARAVPSDLARQIASAASAEIQTEVRDSGYLLAVTYDADLLGVEDGFTFARCGARAVVYDTDSGRIVGTTEVKPKKGGHLHFQGAVDKGCSEAERALGGWVEATMRSVSAEPGRAP